MKTIRRKLGDTTRAFIGTEGFQATIITDPTEGRHKDLCIQIKGFDGSPAVLSPEDLLYIVDWAERNH